MTGDVQEHSTELIACPQCDRLSELPSMREGQKALCRCCGAKVLDYKVNSLNRTCAIAIAGLILFYPALNLPLMGVSAVGLFHQASLLDCILLLVKTDYPLIALSLFLFTVALPIVKLSSALYIATAVKHCKTSSTMLAFFRTYHYLDSWTMLHVFLLGIVVSMYKLVSLASLTIGVGFVAFCLLLVCSTAISLTLDHHLIWRKLECHCEA